MDCWVVYATEMHQSGFQHFEQMAGVFHRCHVVSIGTFVECT